MFEIRLDRTCQCIIKDDIIFPRLIPAARRGFFEVADVTFRLVQRFPIVSIVNGELVAPYKEINERTYAIDFIPGNIIKLMPLMYSKYGIRVRNAISTCSTKEQLLETLNIEDEELILIKDLIELELNAIRSISESLYRVTTTPQ